MISETHVVNTKTKVFLTHGVGTYRRNANEKFDLYRHIFATDREVFKDKFPQESSASFRLFSKQDPHEIYCLKFLSRCSTHQDQDLTLTLTRFPLESKLKLKKIEMNQNTHPIWKVNFDLDRKPIFLFKGLKPNVCK